MSSSCDPLSCLSWPTRAEAPLHCSVMLALQLPVPCPPREKPFAQFCRFMQCIWAWLLSQPLYFFLCLLPGHLTMSAFLCMGHLLFWAYKSHSLTPATTWTLISYSSLGVYPLFSLLKSNTSLVELCWDVTSLIILAAKRRAQAASEGSIFFASYSVF